MPRLRAGLLAVALLTAVGAGGYAATADRGYRVSVVLPVATNLVPGSPVHVGGELVGTIEELETRDGRALVRVELSDDAAPLRDGTTATIVWKAVLGERILELHPGPAAGAEVPDGGMIEGTVDRVEFDQVLAALDPATRARLTSLLQRLDRTVDGDEAELNATLRAAGPTLEHLGTVLEALGSDGPAIRSLVVRLRQMTGTLASRESDLTAITDDLARFTADTVVERDRLSAGLRELPGTLEAAQRTLDRVPGTVDAATPLLRDLAPATRRLPRVARNLSPLLADLRPAVADLRPTLIATRALLGETPALLDGGHEVLPELDSTLGRLQPALAFLRPYTPELAGWLANWASAAANYDSHGNYVRFNIQQGLSELVVNPGVVPPGLRKNPYRKPGALEKQPWSDAHGSGLR
jgi:phospholipid/cholesterol/gamma-HCH transport system substrate-binding protein